MAKSKANTTAGARPKASRREGRAPAAATAKAESGAASALPGRSAAPTKQGAVIGLLQREGGATLADLVDATGWLAHTTRAALTRLRQAGHVLDKGKDETGATVYRIIAPGRTTRPEWYSGRRQLGDGHQSRRDHATFWCPCPLRPLQRR